MRHHPAKCETRLQVDHDTLAEALRLQRIGISVIPIGREKKPALPEWTPFKTTAADEHQVRDWFDRRDDLGLAIILGPVSGNLVARDFDRFEAWERWATEYPKLEQMLPAVETSRGRHVYARIVGCPFMKRKDGELRANKHYVVAPPSVHRSGKQYRWVRGFDTLADVPAITLEESGFGRDWLGTDDQAPEPMPQIGTESVSVRSVSICPYLWQSDGLLQGTIPTAYG